MHSGDLKHKILFNQGEDSLMETKKASIVAQSGGLFFKMFFNQGPGANWEEEMIIIFIRLGNFDYSILPVSWTAFKVWKIVLGFTGILQAQYTAKLKIFW